VYPIVRVEAVGEHEESGDDSESGEYGESTG
jgi:hypothetical protein